MRQDRGGQALAPRGASTTEATHSDPKHREAGAQHLCDSGVAETVICRADWVPPPPNSCPLGTSPCAEGWSLQMH